MMETDIKALNDRIQKESAFIDMLSMEMHKVIIGQKQMIERLMIGLLSNGHVLLEGVPGLAKTLAINSLAKSIDAKFSRIQFTPDLLPADLLGTLIYSQKKEEFVVRKGPIFANFILADEINRSPAKVQSALLEAMQERQVTIGDTTYPLDEPFLVLATQNPIEQEGTYPLPEAQIDRFMFKLIVDYPNRSEERVIIDRMAHPELDLNAVPVITLEDIINARQWVDKVYIDEKIVEYILDITNSTRLGGKGELSSRQTEANLQELDNLILVGASPRASIMLAVAAKAAAFMEGRAYVVPQDVKNVANDILRHRILLTYEAEAEEITSDDVIKRILDELRTP